VLGGCAFPYLAHLPQLHSLDCVLLPDDLGHLAKLRQLRSLTLWLHESEPEEHWMALKSAPWTSAAVRSVGSSRLPLLHTLRLEGSNEDPAGSSDPADPNSNRRWLGPCCDEIASEIDGPRRATHVSIPVEDGLDHLLRLPALTRLALPYVHRDALDLPRSMVASDRPELHIEHLIPHSRRSDFDRRWIEHGSASFKPGSD